MSGSFCNWEECSDDGAATEICLWSSVVVNIAEEPCYYIVFLSFPGRNKDFCHTKSF